MRKEKYVAQIALAAALYGANRLFPIDKIGTVINFWASLKHDVLWVLELHQYLEEPPPKPLSLVGREAKLYKLSLIPPYTAP